MELSPTEREYRDEIERIAEDIRDEIGKGNLADENAVQESLWQTCDSHQFVIYTWKARCVGMISDNEDAIEDLGPQGLIKDGRVNHEGIAMMAMIADVQEEIGEGFDDVSWDFNDDATWPANNGETVK